MYPLQNLLKQVERVLAGSDHPIEESIVKQARIYVGEVEQELKSTKALLKDWEDNEGDEQCPHCGCYTIHR